MTRQETAEQRFKAMIQQQFGIDLTQFPVLSGELSRNQLNRSGRRGSRFVNSGAGRTTAGSPFLK